MAKADRRVCVGSDRCYAFPDRLQDARQTCTPKGRCKVGWIVSRSRSESWDVWLKVSTGLVKLVAQVDACASNDRGRGAVAQEDGVNKGRVAWYDGEGYEFDAQDFRHESEALRKRERWKKERPTPARCLNRYQ